MSVSGGLLLVVLWLALWFILSNSILQRIQLVRHTKTTWISALPDSGRVEVVGKIHGKSTRSALGGKPCVVWQVEVLKIRQSKNRTSWKRIYEHTSPNLFMVEDGTGKIQINPKDAEIILPEGELIEESRLILEGKLENLGFRELNKLTKSDSLQVFERRVSEDEEIYVVGHVEQDIGEKILSGTSSDPLVIRIQSERESLGKLYGQVALKGFMTLFILLGAMIIYFGLLRS